MMELVVTNLKKQWTYDAISGKVYFQEYKSSRSQVFSKIDVRKASAKFTGKYLF